MHAKYQVTSFKYQTSVKELGRNLGSSRLDIPRNPSSDLEERTYQFAKDVRSFVRQLPRTISNAEDVRQLVKASGSVGANYIEAQEALSRKDFRMRVRISRKETKEARHFLRLVFTNDDPKLHDQRNRLIQECNEFLKILSAIINKCK